MIVSNIGNAPASGPFTIVLGVLPYGGPYIESTFDVPATVTIPPGAFYISDSMKNIPIVRLPGGSCLFEYDIRLDQAGESKTLLVRDHRCG